MPPKKHARDDGADALEAKVDRLSEEVKTLIAHYARNRMVDETRDDNRQAMMQKLLEALERQITVMTSMSQAVCKEGAAVADILEAVKTHHVMLTKCRDMLLEMSSATEAKRPRMMVDAADQQQTPAPALPPPLE